MDPVLIADRDPAARRALTLILKHKLAVEDVREVGDVETLIRALADCQPRLLMLDWTMYGAPAPETCRLLRKAYPTLNIVLLSADAGDEGLARQAGASFIDKGATPEKLVATLEGLLQD